jgi:integrase
VYGSTLGREFGPLALESMQQHWSKRWSRKNINHQIGRVKRFFRWICKKQLVPSGLYHDLACVDPLISGKCDARELPPVGPAEKKDVDALLPYLQPAIAAMVQVQYLCGMRPGEVCMIRGCDLITNEEIWLCKIPNHKNAWRGHVLVKAVPAAAKKTAFAISGR